MREGFPEWKKGVPSFFAQPVAWETGLDAHPTAGNMRRKYVTYHGGTIYLASPRPNAIRFLPLDLTNGGGTRLALILPQVDQKISAFHGPVRSAGGVEPGIGAVNAASDEGVRPRFVLE